MKTSALKLIIKEAVKEAIQEELKEILLEAVKTPRVITQAPITENINAPSPIIPQSPSMSSQDKRDAYKNILGDTAASFTSNSAQSFQPQAGMDTANGTLPAGEVDMNQILGLMNK